ncbi:DUF721 domain-containing protein [bacterium]|nr:DUF721 domain-containing protein [bacterium]
MRKKDEFEDIKTILERIIKKNNLTGKFLEEELRKKWPDLIGKEISNHITPLSVKNKILYVKVENSTWNNDFNFLKKDILEKIKLNISKDLVKNIISKV